MLKEPLHKLCAFIKSANKYFSAGFPDAWQDEETSCIFTRSENNELQALFPNDMLGDYFYLRNEKKTIFAPAPAFAIADGINAGIETRTPIHLIAIVRNGDPQMLLQNLVNTLQFYPSSQIALVNAIWNPEDVVLSEMKGAENADQLAALSRVQDQAIVAITFNLINKMPLQQLSCITNPCKTC